MARHLEHLEQVWHPHYGVRVVIELEESQVPPEVEDRKRAVLGEGVWTVSIDDYVTLVNGEPYVGWQLLRWFGEHELARVGEG